jgi:hypothetical protein
VKVLPLKEEEEREGKWWSWNGYNVPMYEAMPSRKDTPEGEKKRMFYFQA